MAQVLDTKYFERVLTLVPEKYDSEHPSVVYFCVLALGILSAQARRAQQAEDHAQVQVDDQGQTSAPNQCVNKVDGKPNAKYKPFQVFDKLVPSLKTYLKTMFTGCGFRATCYGIDEPHILATYFCLAIAAMIEYEFSSTEKQRIEEFIKRCRFKGGMYCLTETEATFNSSALVSLRTTYSAFSSLALLGIPITDTESVEYIKKLQNYDGGFGETQYDESHAGLTFCALASLNLANALDEETGVRAARFLLRRQTTDSSWGFNGRPGKEPDCCYMFWVLTSLRIIGVPVDNERVLTSTFLKSCFDPILKAYGPVPESEPDAYHTALVLAAQNPAIVDKSLVIARGCLH